MVIFGLLENTINGLALLSGVGRKTVLHIYCEPYQFQ